MKNNFKVHVANPSIGKNDEIAVMKVLKSKWLSEGKVTEEFENRLSDYLSSEVVVVNNGSSALMAALIAHNFKPGDKIVVPAFTFIATSSIPKILGAQVLVADVDLKTLNLVPKSVESLVKKYSVKFVMPVDVGGLPIDVNVFKELSDRYNFVLIEDSAQAFGSEYRNRKIGSFNHLTTFSFQITKQLTVVEGGCIASTNSGLIKKIRKIKDYGRSTKGRYIHDVVGTNFRTTDLQSSIGIEQLKQFDKYLKKRNKIALTYKAKLKGLDFQNIPKYVTKHSYYMFFAMANGKTIRNKLMNHLIRNGVDAREPWLPLQLQPCNPELKKFSCKNSIKIFEKTFNLPIFNNMTREEINLVIESCKKIL